MNEKSFENILILISGEINLEYYLLLRKLYGTWSVVIGGRRDWCDEGVTVEFLELGVFSSAHAIVWRIKSESELDYAIQLTSKTDREIIRINSNQGDSINQIVKEISGDFSDIFRLKYESRKSDRLSSIVEDFNYLDWSETAWRSRYMTYASYILLEFKKLSSIKRVA